MTPGGGAGGAVTPGAPAEKPAEEKPVTVTNPDGTTTTVSNETKEDGTGAVTSSKATVELTGKDGKVTIDSATVKAITDAAGTDAVITMTVKDSSVSVNLKDKGTYRLEDTKTAAKIEKKILSSVKAAKTSVKVKKGKKTKVALASSFNKENAKSITFSTTDKKILKVSKSGTVKALKKGSAVVSAKVVLKNGKTKTVKIKVAVK